MKTFLALTVLLGGLAAAQTSIMNIPALPPGKTAPAPAATTPVAAPSTTSTTSTTTVTTTAPATTAPAAAPVAPTVTTLPTGTTALDVTAELVGPDTVTAGEANTWDFTITNKSSTNLHLEHGACDVRFEVVNEAGQVVRPDPKNAICTMQLVITDVQPGESAVVQKIRWEGKDGQGKPVPAGKYTIRARFVSGGNFTPAATKDITVQ